MLHAGNAFDKDGKFISDNIIYTYAKGSPFENFVNENLNKGFKEINLGNSFRRFEIDLETSELTYRDLSSLDWGNYDLPNYNSMHDGVKENCYTI